MIISIIEEQLFDDSSRYDNWSNTYVPITYREYSALMQLLDYLVQDLAEYPDDLLEITETLMSLVTSHARDAMRSLGRMPEGLRTEEESG